MQIVKQKQTKLSTFLDGNYSLTDILTRNPEEQTWRTKQKKKYSRRFNTTSNEQFQCDFRIKTYYEPNQQYKFTGECYKNKYSSNKKMNLQKNQNQCTNDFTIQSIVDTDELQQVNSEICQKNLRKQKKIENLFKISKPAPIRQPEFVMKVKKNFLKKYLLTKNENDTDLIKIQDFLTDKKQKFKRSIVCQLISNGQAKLLSQIKEQKGKIYLEALHLIKQKQQRLENNFQTLLIKSRNSFSSPNQFLSHLKPNNQKKSKKFSLSE